MPVARMVVPEHNALSPTIITGVLQAAVGYSPSCDRSSCSSQHSPSTRGGVIKNASAEPQNQQRRGVSPYAVVSSLVTLARVVNCTRKNAE